MLLNLKQIGDFKRDGFLILRSFIENKTIDQWRKQFWKQVGGCYSDKSSWSTASSTNNPKLTPELGSLPKIEAIVEQVGGYNFKGGGCGVLGSWQELCAHIAVHRFRSIYAYICVYIYIE